MNLSLKKKGKYMYEWMYPCMSIEEKNKQNLIFSPPIGSLIKSKSNKTSQISCFKLLLRSHVSNLTWQFVHKEKWEDFVCFVGLFSVFLCWECQAIILWVLPCHSSEGELMMMHWHLGLSTWLIPQEPTRKSQKKKRKEKIKVRKKKRKKKRRNFCCQEEFLHIP